MFFNFKTENFQLKNFDIFLIFAQNIDCGYTLEPPRRGGSNEYPQSMFWSKNKKNRYTPAYPRYCYIKVGFKGVYITRTCFPDDAFQVAITMATSEMRSDGRLTLDVPLIA